MAVEVTLEPVRTDRYIRQVVHEMSRFLKLQTSLAHLKTITAMRTLHVIGLVLPLGCQLCHAFKSANLQSSAVQASLRRQDSFVVRLASEDDSSTSSSQVSSVDSVEKTFSRGGEQTNPSPTLLRFAADRLALCAYSSPLELAP